MKKLPAVIAPAFFAGSAGGGITEGLAAFHKGEIDKWWPIIKAAGIKME